MLLSNKHGLNPSLSCCFYCGGDKNEIILAGLMNGDAEAPRKGIWNYDPCDTCRDNMEQGILLISVDESKSKNDNEPYRSGSICVIKEDAFERIFSGDTVESALKCRFCFVSDEAWDMIGLPRENANER